MHIVYNILYLLLGLNVTVKLNTNMNTNGNSHNSQSKGGRGFSPRRNQQTISKAGNINDLNKNTNKRKLRGNRFVHSKTGTFQSTSSQSINRQGRDSPANKSQEIQRQESQGSQRSKTSRWSTFLKLLTCCCFACKRKAPNKSESQASLGSLAPNLPIKPIYPLRDITDGLNVAYYIGNLLRDTIITYIIDIIKLEKKQKFVHNIKTPVNYIEKNGIYPFQQYCKYVAFIIYEQIKNSIITPVSFDKSVTHDSLANDIYIIREIIENQHSFEIKYKLSDILICTIDLVIARSIWITRHCKIERSDVVLPNACKNQNSISFVDKSREGGYKLHIFLNVLNNRPDSNNNIIYPESEFIPWFPNSTEYNLPDRKQDDDDRMLASLEILVCQNGRQYKIDLERVPKSIDINKLKLILKNYNPQPNQNKNFKLSYLVTSDKFRDYLLFYFLKSNTTFDNIVPPDKVIEIENKKEYIKFASTNETLLRLANNLSNESYC